MKTFFKIFLLTVRLPWSLIPEWPQFLHFNSSLPKKCCFISFFIFTRTIISETKNWDWENGVDVCCICPCLTSSSYLLLKSGCTTSCYVWMPCYRQVFICLLICERLRTYLCSIVWILCTRVFYNSAFNHLTFAFIGCFTWCLLCLLFIKAFVLVSILCRTVRRFTNHFIYVHVDTLNIFLCKLHAHCCLVVVSKMPLFFFE